jgi:hypothetical protein
MATAKQQAQPRYGVTLLIEGSQLKTMAKQAKQTFGDALVKVEKVEKMPPAPGEWTLTEDNSAAQKCRLPAESGCPLLQDG